MLYFRLLRNVLWTSVLCGIAGCGGREAVLPEEGRTMLEIYQGHLGSGGHQAGLTARSAGALSAGARSALRRSVSDDDVDPQSYTRTAQNEIEALFIRLPNPDLILYVFPHLATGEGVPIPGYSTVFPLYDRVIYALPGEVP